MRYVFYATIILASITFSSNSLANDVTQCAQPDAGIGEIVGSLLKKSDFQNLYGPDWELLDGGKVGQVEMLAYLAPQLQDDEGNSFLPDARGKFLRMNNNGLQSDKADPDVNRFLGSEQMDELQKHTHQYQPPRHYNSGAGSHRRAKADGAKQATSEVGGDETRPKNISVNFFVRVSKTDRGCNG